MATNRVYMAAKIVAIHVPLAVLLYFYADWLITSLVELYKLINGTSEDVIEVLKTTFKPKHNPISSFVLTLSTEYKINPLHALVFIKSIKATAITAFVILLGFIQYHITKIEIAKMKLVKLMTSS